MPPFIIPQSVLVRLIWQLEGNDAAVNVLTALNPANAAITQTLANTIGTAIKAAFSGGDYGPRCGTDFALGHVGIRDIAVANMAEYLDTGAAEPSGGTGDCLPLNTAAVTTLKTARAGQYYQGRVFLTGWSEAVNVSPGVPEGTVPSASLTFLTAVQSALSASGLQLAVGSRANDALTPPKPAFSTQVTGFVPRSGRWFTQRRRLNPGI